jgi:SAM-dependent methyltransferase
VDFAALASRYDELRPSGTAWHEVAEAALVELRGTTRLLDVGCGTGRFAVLAAERLGARVWGVDPSADMLAQARARAARGVGWRQASAERLPFRAGWFDGAHAHLVMHLLDDRPAALHELARVLSPGGRLVLISFRPEHFDRFHLNPYFPSIVAIDQARFPDPAVLVHETAIAGFAEVAERGLIQRVALEPADVLERVRGRYISTLHLLSEDEYREGLARLECDLAHRPEPIVTDLHWSVVSARRAPATP